MKAIPAVPKADRNSSQNFNFRGIDAVINAVGPQLRNHGVLVVPKLLTHHVEDSVTAKGTKMRFVTLLVNYTFYGPEGDELTATVPGEAMDSGDKAYSKAMSVAWRTALLQTLALPTDEPDPDVTSYERAEPIQVAKRELADKMAQLKLDVADVKTMYHAESGTQLKDETDAEKVKDFTKRLGA
jgi:hypothetical protein